MSNWTITVTLGAGEKGKQWRELLDYHSKKNRMSAGAYIRAALYDKVKAEMPKNQAPEVAKPTGPVEKK